MNLEEYLKNAGVWYRFIDKTETVHTGDAARAAGIDLGRVTKNLVCQTSTGRHALLVIPGNRRVNLQRAAYALSAKNVKLLSFKEAEEASGYPPGATPSVHHRNKLDTVVDSELLQYETIFCGGGSRSRLLELHTEDVIRLSEATVSFISEKDPMAE